MTRPFNRRLRAVIVTAGLVLPQAVLFGPSLVGRKILLPLDLLALPNAYLPGTAQSRRIAIEDWVLTDQVTLQELDRRFAAVEWRAGRVPLWRPAIFAGVPFVTHAKYSPFNLLYYLFDSPFALAWIQLLKSVFAGVGAYLFLRRVVGVGFAPAAIAAWCYPVTGFFVYSLGMPITLTTAWLPWSLLAVDACVRRPTGVAGPVLALATAAVLTSGQIDMAGLVLLASGLYALFVLGSVYGAGRDARGAARAAAITTAAWVAGFLLASPYTLPLLEYAQTTARMLRRGAGDMERPPLGLAALVQMVLPEFYGATRRGFVLLLGPNQLENAAGTYAGLLATLVAAPLAWCSRRHRALTLFLALLTLIAVSWQLDLAPFKWLWRLPGINMLSYNRFVFVASFAIVTAAAIGLEVLWDRGVERRRWFWVPCAVALLLGALCMYRLVDPPPLPSWLWSMKKAEALVRHNFHRTHFHGLLLCLLAAAAWVALWLRPHELGRWAPLLGAIMLVELTVSAAGKNPQKDPGLYYPRVPALEALARAPAGRMVCVGCLPPNLAETHGLSDVRGYDAMDPGSLLELLDLPGVGKLAGFACAMTAAFEPAYRLTEAGGARVSPVLDVLGLRYLVFRGHPPAGARPVLAGDDYWVLENQAALPRAFIPRSAVGLPRDEVARRLSAPDFDPRAVAYVSEAAPLPAPTEGRARIVREIPTEVTVAVEATGPALLVLADRWDPGWRAYVDGRPAPIVHANLALRGVITPAGASTVVFRYQPAGLARGVRLMALAAAVLLLWLGLLRALERRHVRAQVPG